MSLKEELYYSPDDNLSGGEDTMDDDMSDDDHSEDSMSKGADTGDASKTDVGKQGHEKSAEEIKRLTQQNEELSRKFDEINNQIKQLHSKPPVEPDTREPDDPAAAIGRLKEKFADGNEVSIAEFVDSLAPAIGGIFSKLKTDFENQIMQAKISAQREAIESQWEEPDKMRGQIEEAYADLDKASRALQAGNARPMIEFLSAYKGIAKKDSGVSDSDKKRTRIGTGDNPPATQKDIDEEISASLLENISSADL